MFTSQPLTFDINNKNQDYRLVYWKKTLKDTNSLNLFIDFSTKLPTTDNKKYISISLEKNLIENLKNQFAQYTTDDILITSLYALLFHYSHETDICLAVSTKRNYLPLRLKFNDQMNFADLLAIFKQITEEASAYQLPLETIINKITGTSLLFQISIAFNKKPDSLRLLPSAPYFDIYFQTSTDGDYNGQCFINTSLFKSTSIERLLLHWEQILIYLARHGNCELINLPLLLEKEKILIDHLNATDLSNPFPITIADYFHQVAEEVPEKQAVVFHQSSEEKQSITYKTLDELTTQIANYCQTLFRNDDKTRVIGISIIRSPWLIIGMIAAFKTGFPLVILETKKDKGLENKLNNHQFGFILVDDSTRLLFNAKETINIINLQDKSTMSQIQLTATNYQSPAVTLNDVAYVTYTSGATGIPKGVLISHQGLTNLSNWLRTNFRDNMSVLSIVEPTFDAFIHDCLVAMQKGTLHLSTQTLRFDPLTISTIIKKENINFCVFLPNVLSNIPTNLDSLEYLTSMGATPDAETLKKWLAKLNLIVLNGYGPSENTIITTVGKCKIDRDITIIGKPIANTKLFILNPKTLTICPPDIPGEIYITGPGIAIGYNDPALTSLAFPYMIFDAHTNAFKKVTQGTPGATKFYATGDYAVYQINHFNKKEKIGIKFIGRKDRQVKINGVRVELDGIEAQLQKHPDIKQIKVIVTTSIIKKPILIFFVVLHEHCNKDEKTMLKNIYDYLKEHTAFTSSHYPQQVKLIKEMPLTQNDKIDEQHLIQHFTQPSEMKPIPPSTLTQKKILALLAEILSCEIEVLGMNFSLSFLGATSLQGKQFIDKTCEWLTAEYKIREISESSWPLYFQLLPMNKIVKIVEKIKFDWQTQSSEKNSSALISPPFKSQKPGLGLYASKKLQKPVDTSSPTKTTLNKIL